MLRSAGGRVTVFVLISILCMLPAFPARAAETLPVEGAKGPKTAEHPPAEEKEEKYDGSVGMQNKDQADAQQTGVTEEEKELEFTQKDTDEDRIGKTKEVPDADVAKTEEITETTTEGSDETETQKENATNTPKEESSPKESTASTAKLTSAVDTPKTTEGNTTASTTQKEKHTATDIAAGSSTKAVATSTLSEKDMTNSTSSPADKAYSTSTATSTDATATSTAAGISKDATSTSTHVADEIVGAADATQEDKQHTSDLDEAAANKPEKKTASTATQENEQADTNTVTVHNSINRYQFADDECVTVGDGSFYCSETEDTKRVRRQKDGIIATPDSDGDSEIYLIRGGEKHKLTDNQYEDMAPQYDPVSERIVWHRLKNDRYQIISYDTETGEETQLTDTQYNNMEPVAFGDVSVWQAWIDGNWEILMHAGGETMQLTDNDTPDVTPFVNEAYILWQTETKDGWYVTLYDRSTGVTEMIEHEDGTAVLNPRFVLVYDTYLENGDIQTLGYDLKTKKVVPLSSTPAPLPENLPDPDPIKEKRALIQNKPQNKKALEDFPDEEPKIDPPIKNGTSTVGNMATTSASSTDSGTIVIPPAATSTTSDASTTPLPDVADATATSSENTATSSTKDTAHIDDVVIPQYASKKEE